MTLRTADAAKPFLRWAGSKRKLLPKLVPYWDPKFKRYIEPFMGSACLFFALTPRNALLSDINKELVATYRTVRDSPAEVYRRYSRFRIGKSEYYMTPKSS